MKNEKISIFGYKSEKSIKKYNRLLMIPYLLITFFILFLIMRPIVIDVLKLKTLPFNNPWLFIIFYPMLIGICHFIAIIVHELGHVFFGILAGKSFYSITFLICKIEYTKELKKFRFHFDCRELHRDGFFTFGSVVMAPKNVKYDSFKEIFYYLGGIIFNLLAWILLFIFHGNSLLSLMMLHLGLLALIPYRYSSATGGADGYLAISTLFSDELREIYKIQHEALKYLELDVKLTSDEIFKISEYLIDSQYLNNKCLAYFLLANYYIDNKDYAKATEYINKMKDMKEAFWYIEDEIKGLEDKILGKNHQLSGN
ncbi:MAG: hypothetical protein SPI74_00985 [Eubacterium sp.]|nr:hypothetical protein [Eubacterium sp.]